MKLHMVSQYLCKWNLDLLRCLTCSQHKHILLSTFSEFAVLIPLQSKAPSASCKNHWFILDKDCSILGSTEAILELKRCNMTLKPRNKHSNIKGHKNEEDEARKVTLQSLLHQRKCFSTSELLPSKRHVIPDPPILNFMSPNNKHAYMISASCRAHAHTISQKRKCQQEQETAKLGRTALARLWKPLDKATA